MDLARLQEVIAPFLGIRPDEVTVSTLINRGAIQSSVKTHRLRSELKKAGIDISHWDSVNCVGDLLDVEGVVFHKNYKEDSPANSSDSACAINDASKFGIGVDIESVGSIPDSEDFYTDIFFLENFSKKEISYCSRSKNPSRCFAGRFAAKEAVFKSTRGLCGKDFSRIEIRKNKDNSIESDFGSLSISYLKGVESKKGIVVAVSLPRDSYIPDMPKVDNSTNLDASGSKPVKNSKSYKFQWAILLAMILYILLRDFSSLLKMGL